MHIDRQTADLALRLERLAPTIAAAKDHICRQYALTDGQVQAATTDNGGHGSSIGDDNVQRTILARADLANRAADINDDLDAIDGIIRSCYTTCIRIIGTRLRIHADRCYSTPQYAGYLLPLDEGGWFDPACRNPPRAAEGQCDTCRKRMERWRTRNEQPDLDDDRPIRHDSTIRLIGGVALSRPVRGTGGRWASQHTDDGARVPGATSGNVA